MTYKSDGDISKPHNPRKITAKAKFGGFGWSSTGGLYIPVEHEDDNIDAPYPTGVNARKIPNG